MRILIPFLCLASFLLAQDAPAPAPAPAEAIVKDGKLTEPTWHFTYEARGLERGLSTAKQGVLFEGRAAGSVQIELLVAEAPKKRTDKEWMASIKELFTKGKRAMKDVEESEDGLATLVFTESKLDIFTEHHGYAFYPRGFQCFIIHAYVADKTEKSGARIKECLQGLKLEDKPGPSMYAFRIAQQNGVSINDPRVLLHAGRMYTFQEQGKNLAMAVQVLTQARKTMKKDTFQPGELWALYEAGGFAHLAGEPKNTKAAIEWLSLAEKTAATMPAEQRKEAKGQSAYNLACAYSLAGEVEKGFEALDRAFSEFMPVDAGHLEKDTDLNNLKKDSERWDKFWKARVAGR